METILPKTNQDNQTSGGFSPSPHKNITSRVRALVVASAGLILVLLLIGGGAILAGRVWDPLWNPFRPNPTKTISTAFLNFQKSTTMHTVSMLDIVSDNQLIKGSFAGDIDSSDINAPKIEGVVQLTYQNADQKINPAYLNLDLKVIGTDTYVSIFDYSPEIAKYFLGLGINVSLAKDQWLLIPSDGPLQSVIPIASIKKAVLDKKTFSVKKNLPDQMFKGQKIYHYLIESNNEVLLHIFQDTLAADFFKEAGTLSIDVGIGSDDGNLQSMSLSKKQLENDAGKKIDVTVHVENSKFNELVIIKAPTDFLNIDEIN